MLAPLRSNRWIQSKCHRNRVRKANSILPGLNLVSLTRVAIALDRKVSKFRIQLLDVSDVRFTEYGVSSGKLPSNEFHGKTAAHHDPRRLGIDPNVVLCGGRDVAFAARRSSHHHTTTDSCRNSGPSRECESNVG